MNQKNILLIFTDQQRYDTIEALGNPIIKTPALNSLVKEGVTFSRAYTPCPVCIPARYAMHTGQMPHRTDCVKNEITPNDRTSFMQILSENGYQTHGVGKMHFYMEGLPTTTLWGYESRDYDEGPDNDYRKYLNENGFEHVYDFNGVRSEMYYIPQPSQLPARLHNSTWVADKSIEFLQKRDLNRPFMMMTSFVDPHPPFEAPTPWNKLYRGPEMPLPKRPQDSENLISFWNRYQNRYKFMDQGTDDNLIRTMKAAYYSSISFIDYNVSRLISYMDENGLMDNTLIIFTADHGEMLGDYNCFGKRCFLDPSVRIPMIMRHPDLPKGEICDKPVNLTDVLPTMLDYAGIKPEEDYFGDSMSSIASDSVQRDITFGQFQRDENANYMAVTKDFKYIYSAPDQKEWLFDLKTDPEETRNKAYNLMYGSHKKDIKQKLISYLTNDGYEKPFENGDWKKAEVKKLNDDPDSYLLYQDIDESIPNIPGYQRDILKSENFIEFP